MNKSNYGSHYGITQYRAPHDYELACRKLTLAADGGGDALTLTFRDREFLVCACCGEEQVSAYEALKIDASAHLVFFGTEDLGVAVIDLESGTAAVSLGQPNEYGFYKIEKNEWAVIVNGDVPAEDACGAADAAGAEMPALTDEMTDTHIRWFLGCDRFIELLFTEPGRCEVVWSPKTEKKRAADACCIHIRGGLYLTEVNRTSPMWSDMPQGYSRMVFLQDYKRLLMVGGVYSPVLNDLKLISGYGEDPEA